MLLENNGIPAFIGSEDTSRILPSAVMSQAGLWVYLDHQHHDAYQLLLNSNHEVMTAINVDDFYKAQPNKEQMHSLLSKTLIKMAITILVAMVGVFIVVRVIDAYIK